MKENMQTIMPGFTHLQKARPITLAFFSGDPKRIQHFMKVHSFARIIGTKEGLDETSLFLLESSSSFALSASSMTFKNSSTVFAFFMPLTNNFLFKIQFVLYNDYI